MNTSGSSQPTTGPREAGSKAKDLVHLRMKQFFLLPAIDTRAYYRDLFFRVEQNVGATLLGWKFKLEHQMTGVEDRRVGQKPKPVPICLNESFIRTF